MDSSIWFLLFKSLLDIQVNHLYSLYTVDKQTFFSLKLCSFSYPSIKICGFGTLIERVLSSTNKRCFGWGLRKVIFNYHSYLGACLKDYFLCEDWAPEVIKLFPCSTQLSIKFILLINVIMTTISQGRSGLPCEFDADLWWPMPNQTLGDN